MKVDSLESDISQNVGKNLSTADGVQSENYNSSDRLASEPDNPADEKQISEKDLEKAVEDLQKIAANLKSRLSFSTDESTGKTVIRVLDDDSGKIIRQIPPEDMLRLSARMDEVIGVLFDKGV
jgi:flagellar protein FlaG